MGKLYEFGGLSIEHCDLQVSVDGHPTQCPHLQLIMDENGQTVSCGKCGAQVTPWWALLALISRYDAATQALLKLRRSQSAHQVAEFPQTQATPPTQLG